MRDVHDLHGGVRGDSYVHGGVLHDDGVLRGIHVLHGPVHDGGFRDVHADILLRTDHKRYSLKI